MKKQFRLTLLSLVLLVSPTLFQCSQNPVTEKPETETSSLSNASDTDMVRQAAEQLANSYFSKTPASSVTDRLTLAQAKQIQAEFVQTLAKKLGDRIGYKAGLTSTPAQEQFGVQEPLLGVLFEQMLLPNGAVLTADFGVRPMTEGDLMVRVGSEEINNAKTMQEVLANLDAVIPFIELPDLVYGPEVKMTSGAIAAVNIGARYGVLGDPVLLAGMDDWQTRLSNISVEIFDADGKLLATGNSSALLGHPLKVVLWIKDALQVEGKQLQKGDLLSLGTITPLMPVKPNTTIRAKYIGLDPNGDVEISVQFK